MADATQPGNTSQTGGGTHGIEGLRVLYAEDHPAMQRAVRRLLQVAGASVVTAHDGREAIEKALAGTFDLIVMDLRMPRMDGFEAACALRAGGCRAPLVAVTAEASPDIRATALAAGFDAVLSKPFSLSDLIHALQFVRQAQPEKTSIAGATAGPDISPP